MLKNLVFIVKASQDYIRYNGENAKLNEPQLNLLFESITNTYIPLISMEERFIEKGIKAKIGLVLPPVLCTMLSAPEVQDLYIENLDKKIQLGQKELLKYKDKGEASGNCGKIAASIEKTIEKLTLCKSLFEEKYQKNLIKCFADLQKKGMIEILGTCGTDVFVPHYMDLPEIISAQIETGLNSYKRYFDEVPEGFFLPECGFAPNVDKIVKAFGYSYTVVTARSLLLAKDCPSRGIFFPCRTENTLAVFGSDPDFTERLFGEEGFAANTEYRNENRDIGFELSGEELEPLISKGSARYSTGYKYYKRYFDDDPNEIYDFNSAQKSLSSDAEAFVAEKAEKLEKASGLVENTDFVCSVCVFDAALMQKNWYEGMNFLEAVIEKAVEKEINVTSCNTMISKIYRFEKITPYYSADAGLGYGENFLSSKNSWLMRYLRKSSERMIDLADRFPNDTGLKTRLLNLGAKELLIAQSTGISKMLENDEFTEYAEKRFKDSIASFTAVFDSLGSNTVSTEWLTNLEVDDNLFPWMNYRIFSKKK